MVFWDMFVGKYSHSRGIFWVNNETVGEAFLKNTDT
jgi:hypothetical protein